MMAGALAARAPRHPVLSRSACVTMPFFVAIHQRAWPERLDELLATIGSSLRAARRLHPERRSTRVFQRLGEPTRLLALSEWADEGAFDRFRQWPVFVDAVTRCGPS